MLNSKITGNTFANRVFSIAFATYLFFAQAIPLAYLKPVQAASGINSIQIDAALITETTITVTANASQIDEADIVSMGVCYSTDGIAWTCVPLTPTGYNGPGNSTKYTQTITGLNPGTTYYIKAYITTATTTYSQQYAGTITTLGSTPTPDTTAPVVTVPSNITVDATSALGAIVTFTSTATDTVDGAITPLCTPASGSLFGITTTTVTCTATDAAGNTGSASFTITVNEVITVTPDTTAPVVNVPANIVNSTTSDSGMSIDYVVTATDDIDSIVTPTCNPVSGSILPIGTTSVSCSATDAAGNTGTGSFTITINKLTITLLDVIAPVLTVPADMIVEATGLTGATVTFIVTANDETDGLITPICSPVSGSTFALGSTNVSCSATDTAGNTSTDTFIVTVEDTTAPVVPTLISPADGAHIKNAAFAQTWSAVSDAVLYSYQSCYVDPGDLNGPCGSVKYSATYTGTTKSVSAGQPDSHFWWRVKAKDAAGNWSNWSEAWELTIDSTAPVLTVPANMIVEAASASGANALFTATATDATDGTITPVCTPSSGSLFPLGATTVNCTATDLAGNTSTGSFTVTVVDTTAPKTPINLHFANSSSGNLSCGLITNINYVTVDWDLPNDPDNVGVVGYNYFIDYPLPGGGRSTWGTNPTASQYSGTLNQGIHYVKVRAVDAAGNTSDWTSLCSITYDSIAPAVQITSPVSTLLKGTVEIRGTVTDANPHHYWLVIQNSFGTKVAGPGTVNDTTLFTDKKFFDWDTTTVPDGVYTIKLEARDAANNKDSGSVHWLTVTVDNSLPTVSKVDNAIINEGDAFPAITMEATDNTNLSQVCLVVTAPGFELTTETAVSEEMCDSVTGTSVTYDVNEWFNLPSIAWALPSNKPDALPEGDYTFEYWAIDEVGNESEHQTTTYTLVNLAPTVSADTLTNSNRSITLTANGLGGNAPLVYTWSDGNFASCTSSSLSVTTPTTAGTYTCKVTVTDEDGETDDYTAVVTVAAAPVVPTTTQTPTVRRVNTPAPTTTPTVTPTVVPTEKPEVLGARTCNTQKRLQGLVFIDANNDGEYTIGEERVAGVKLGVSYTVDSEKFTVGTLTSDESGNWGIDLCSGGYTLTVLLDSLPNNATIQKPELQVTVSDQDEITNVPILLTEVKKKSWLWLWILLLILALTTGGYIIYRRKKLENAK